MAKCFDCDNLPAKHKEIDKYGNFQWVFDLYGYCASCWVSLKPEERAVLKGEEPPVKEIIHEVKWETPPLPSTIIKEIHVPPDVKWKMPPQPGWFSLLVVRMWRVVVSGLLVYLLYKMLVRIS